MKRPFYFILFALCVSTALSAAPKREFYEIKIYHVANSTQEQRVEKFLKEAYLPALHRAGITKVGVFKPVETDTTFGKRIYVLTPFASMDQFVKLPETLLKDKQYESSGTDYLNAPYDNPPYARIETIVLQAFTKMTQLEVPKLSTPVNERVYELRSYEGYTEKIYRNKVKMFNDGNEVALFKRLGFNAVFYAEVVSGSRMPNLMYMTTFANQASRDEHWKAFSADPEWKTLSGMSEYQHNVSKINIYFLRPVEYSDI